MKACVLSKATRKLRSKCHRKALCFLPFCSSQGSGSESRSVGRPQVPEDTRQLPTYRWQRPVSRTRLDDDTLSCNSSKFTATSLTILSATVCYWQVIFPHTTWVNLVSEYCFSSGRYRGRKSHWMAAFEIFKKIIKRLFLKKKKTVYHSVIKSPEEQFYRDTGGI